MSMPEQTIVPDVSAPDYYYYDMHPTDEDLMGDSDAQAHLMRYLAAVLREMYRELGWYVSENLNIYWRADRGQYPLAPDVALFPLALSAEERWSLRSWRMLLPNRPPPLVVFEIGSEETWGHDIDDMNQQGKPRLYGQVEVREYFAYDPRVLAREPVRRLYGWRYGAAGELQALEPDERGWLWSEVLESWLVPAEGELHLFDRAGVRRLTREEAAEQQAFTAREQAQRAEQEARVARERAERMAAKLRELGIDPDTIQGQE